MLGHEDRMSWLGPTAGMTRVRQPSNRAGKQALPESRIARQQRKLERPWKDVVEPVVNETVDGKVNGIVN